MFDLVADVEKYPQFVPLCQSLKVRSRTEKGDSTVLVASMTVAYAKGFLMVSASPLTRSSHHAGDDFARLKAARAAQR